MLTTWAHSQAETRIPAPPLFPPHPQLWRELPAVHRWDVEPEITYIVFSFARFLAWTPVGLIDLCFVARAGRPREAALAEFLSHGHVSAGARGGVLKGLSCLPPWAEAFLAPNLFRPQTPRLGTLELQSSASVFLVEVPASSSEFWQVPHCPGPWAWQHTGKLNVPLTS